ncbi:10534_t:CDS:2, partial [Gigaspora rosea]
PQAGLDLLDEDKSNDGTIILRFGEPLIKINGTTTCWGRTIYLRIIHPNASIKVVSVTAFYVLERGFAIAYGGNDSPSSLNSTTNIVSTTKVVYIKFYYLTTNTRRGPFLIYQTPTQTLNSNNSQNFIQTTTLRGLICSVDFDGAGNICMLLMTYQSNITNTTSQYSLLKVSFLSSGSVTSIGKMTNVNFTYGFNLIPLRFGGYLMLVYQGDINFGYVLNEDGNVYSNWSLPQPLVLPKYQSAYVVLVNNSFVFVENQNNSIWNVTRDDLYRFYRQDNRLNNPIIESTSPIIGSQVNESTKKLQFTFAYPVTLSNSNISIYQQINGSNDLLRQRFQGDASSQLCHLYSNDNKTVIIQVFPSTFNEPNSLYYVTIENNFVKRSDSDEALLGIDKNLWTLTTGQITGVIRLTPDGSNHYLSLSSVDQQKFHKQLATDLSSIIPVEDNRLTAADGLEKDMSTGSLQILLPFNIKDTTNLSKKSANKIYQDFNTLLKYKEYSALMNYNTTILIDETYPMTIARNASFAITIHEISKNPDFSKWASKYGQFLPILTIISAGRIEALNVLTSKFGMLEIFSATFSE